MSRHYSQPKGIVGRSICYAIFYDETYYGHIVAGSAVMHLSGRNEFFDFAGTGRPTWAMLHHVINNVFFHIEPLEGKYPTRNFATKIVAQFRERAAVDWQNYYLKSVLGFETLVEVPRTGELYLRDGWTNVGQTKGFTCKREGGVGTDTWSGRRVWDTVNLRPKHVLCRKVDNAIKA